MVKSIGYECRLAHFIDAQTPASYQRGGLPRTCRENSSWEGLGA